MSFSTLIVNAPVERDEVAVRVGRNKDRRQVDRQQRLVVVVGAQTVVELVQQRERVRARRRVVICSVNTWRSVPSRTPAVAPLSTYAVSRLPVTL